MKKNILLLFFVCIANFVFAANEIPEKLIYQDSILLFYIHNDQIITITKGDDRQCVLSINGKIDTLLIPPKQWRAITSYHSKSNSIYITDANYSHEKENVLYKLDLDTKIMDKIHIFPNDSYLYFIVGDTLVRGCEYECESLILYDLCKQLDVEVIEIGQFHITELLAENIILISIFEEEVIDFFSYYDWNNKKLINHIPVLDTMRFEIFTTEDGKKYVKNSINDIFYSYTDISGQYLNMRFCWLDQNFNFIQPTLKSYSSSLSNIINNKYYYRKSIIKNDNNNKDKSVWVACKFTLIFDKALYDIYHNTLLDKTTVENFDKWELHKLKNMVFAKHGYQFQSEYLQAFFNLFQFYAVSNHQSDVFHLLTPEDKKNLELIELMSKNKRISLNI
jgi:hypothetical protein